MNRKIYKREFLLFLLIIFGLVKIVLAEEIGDIITNNGVNNSEIFGLNTQSSVIDILGGDFINSNFDINPNFDIDRNFDTSSNNYNNMNSTSNSNLLDIPNIPIISNTSNNSNKLEISSEIKNLTLSDLKIIIDNYNNSTGNLALNISNSGSRDIIGFILKIIDNESNIWKEDIIDYILLNETKSKNYKLPSNLSKIIVFVDYYNNIEESNESNNFDYWPKSKEPIKLENISVEINNSDNSNKSKNWNKNKLKEKIKSKIKSKFEKGEYKEKYDKKHSNNNNNDDNSQNNKSKESSNKIKTKNLESIWNNCFYDNFSVLSQKYFNERKNLFEKEKNHYTTKAKITSQNKTKKIKN